VSTLRELIVSIDFDDIDTKKLLLVDSAIDEIEDELRKMGGQINDATAEFAAMGAVGEAALNNIRDEADDAKDEVDDLNDELGQTAIRLTTIGTLTGLVAAGFSGIVAAAAPLLVGIGALGASFAAAGAGAVAFGAVATSAIESVFDAAKEVEKLEEKIANADTAKERIAAQKELAALYADMSKEQRNALKELQEFKAFWGDFVKQFEPAIFEAFGNVLDNTEKLFKKLGPAIGVVADHIVYLTEEFGEALDSPEMKGFFDWLTINAGPALYNFAHIFGNVFMGVMNLLQAFSPIGEEVENWLLRITQRFEDWSASLGQSTGFQNFIEYAKENGPILAQTLSNIWDIAVDLVQAFAPLGSEILQSLQSITGYISENITPIIGDAAKVAADFVDTIQNNWPAIRETLIGLGAAFIAFKGIMLGMTIIETITGLMKAYRAITATTTIVQWGLNIAMSANPIGLVVAGIATLIGIGIILWRNWDKLKSKAIELWDSMGKWKIALLALTGPIGAVIAAGVGIYKNWDTIKQKVGSAISSIRGWIDGLVEKWKSFKNALANFKMPKIGLPKFLGGKGLIQADGSHATGLARVPWDGYIAELHKNEAILTATQANALRAAGILSDKGSKPQLNFDGQEIKRASYNKTNNTFAPNITIQINGVNGNEQSIAQAAAIAARKEIERFWRQMQLRQV
jgi:hypothetical protein